MAKQPKDELVPVVVGFNYDVLETKVAEQVRSSANHIRERVKKTVEDIIEVGNDLLVVKEALQHGQFGPWLKAEFGWSERTAQNFMSVTERFKSAKIAELPIQPSAAYFLAAHSVPDEARQVAVEKAEAGEEITFAAAKEIVAEAKKRRGRGGPSRSPPISWLCACLRCWSAIGSGGTGRNSPTSPGSFGSLPTPWRSRSGVGGRRLRRQKDEKFGLHMDRSDREILEYPEAR